MRCWAVQLPPGLCVILWYRNYSCVFMQQQQAWQQEIIETTNIHVFTMEIYVFGFDYSLIYNERDTLIWVYSQTFHKNISLARNWVTSGLQVYNSSLFLANQSECDLMFSINQSWFTEVSLVQVGAVYGYGTQRTESCRLRGIWSHSYAILSLERNL